MNFIKILHFITICLMIVFFCGKSITAPSKQQCYLGQWINISWTDARPDYNVNMSSDAEQTMHTTVVVSKFITAPLIHFKMSISDDNTNRKTVIYNVTTRLCEIGAVVNKIPMVKQAFRSATKKSNYSFKCPMKPGFYYTDTGLGNNPVVPLLYRPNVSYIFEGGVYEMIKKRGMSPLMTFDVKLRVTKLVC